MAFSTEVLADSPVLFWRFDATGVETQVDDQSGNANHLTLHNSPTLEQASLTDATGDYSILFNGTDEGAYCETPAAVKATTSVLTLEAVFSVQGLTLPSNDNWHLLGVLPRNKTEASARISVNDDGRVIARVRYDGGEIEQIVPVGGVGFMSVVHVVLTVGATYQRCYVNGELRAEDDRTGWSIDLADDTTQNPNPGQIYVASSHNSGAAGLLPDQQFTNVLMCETAIYLTELSETRVQAHLAEIATYVAPAVAFRDAWLALSPDNYWRFSEGDVTADIGPNLEHLTQFFPSGLDVIDSGIDDSDRAIDLSPVDQDILYRTIPTAWAAHAAFTQSIVVKAGPNAQTGNIWVHQYRGQNSVPSSATRGCGLWINASNLVEAWAYDTGVGRKTVVYPINIIDDGLWHLFTFVWDGTDLILYHGDDEVGRTACADILRADTTGVPSPRTMFVCGGQFGATVSPSRIYSARVSVDDMVYKSAALTPTEIQGVFAQSGLQIITYTPVEGRSIVNVDTSIRLRGRSYARVSISSAVIGRSLVNVNTAGVVGKSLVNTRTTAQCAGRSIVRVDTNTDFTVATRPGVRWAPRVTVNDTDYTFMLVGSVRTDRNVGAQNATAEFELMPETGELDSDLFDRQPVKIEYRDLDASDTEQFAQVLFTGWVTSAVWVPSSGRLFCSASNRIDARFYSKTEDEVERQVGGFWSSYVFNRSSNGWDHAKDRMETQQNDVWFLDDGSVVSVPWTYDTVDLTWTDDDVTVESLRHEPARRSSITNRVLVRMDYRFAQLQQRMLRCHWSMGGTTWCDRLKNPFPLCQRSMIEGAAKAANGWEVVGTVAFEPVPGPGAYRCFPFAPTNSQKYLLWGGDATEIWAWAAWWTIGRRWERIITEQYEIEVISPISVAANGLSEQVDQYGIESEADNSEWLSERGYRSAGDGFSLVSGSGATEGGTVLGDQTKTTDDDAPGNRVDFENAQVVALEVAAAHVVIGHRHRVIASGLYDPRIKPGMRLRINTSKLQATGQVIAIRHLMSIDEARAVTEVEIGPFVTNGDGFVTPTTIAPVEAPEIPVDEDIPDRLYFPSRVGGLVNSPFYNEEWLGYTTNYEFDPFDLDPFAANPIDIGDRAYPDQFVVEYPEIPESQLQAIETQANQRIEVDVPIDELVRIQ